jgi:LCP family protein required for cell wall assembly
VVIVEGNAHEELERPIADLYSWLADARNQAFDIPPGLIAHLAGSDLPVTPQVTAVMTTTELSTGALVGVVHIEDDVLFAVDEGEGWDVVGFAPTGATPWLGDEPLFLLVLGSDARPGQNQQTLRADSIHILALSPTGNAGTIVGFPRDSYISKEIIVAANETVGLARRPSAGKFTHIMASRGPEIMLAVARELTGLPIAGYFVTGFRGFEGLIDDFGGLTITLPSRIRTGNDFPNYVVGEQWLTGIRALILARTRKTIPGGDFGRSANQGLVILAAMTQAQIIGIDALPDFLNILLEHTWTDLSTSDLVRFGAAGLLMDPAGLDNIVLPGRIGSVGGASVVRLDEDELERVMTDIADDGVLDTGP